MNGFYAAADAFERRAALGKLIWNVKGARCYVRQDDDEARLTITRPGQPDLVHVYPGVRLDDLA
jgi:hypothetical protein